MTIRPHRYKYHRMYWDMVEAARLNSTAQTVKVGAVLVTKTGLVSPGWNGLPAGMKGSCEDYTKTKIDEITKVKRAPTRPEVIHAERNAIDKMTRQGIPTHDAVLFVSHAPCFECAKALHSLGLKAVIYDHVYKGDAGIAFLQKYVPVYSKEYLDDCSSSDFPHYFS